MEDKVEEDTKMSNSKNTDFEKILKTEYSEKFDEYRKNIMVNSYYRYGPVKKNHGEYKCMPALDNIALRLAKYLETGNTEFLCDVANFAMIEFMYPSVDGAHFESTHTGSCETYGFGVAEVNREAENLS